MAVRRQIALILMMTFSCSQSSLAADLSPAKWQPQDRERAEQLEYSPFPPQARVVEGDSGLVAATMSPIAIQAGLETLKQGGTAADAAATVALTQVTTALGSYVSYAGIMSLLYYDAKSGRVYSLDAPWNSYLGETDPKTIAVDDLGPMPFGEKPTKGAQGRKTLVPGFMAGIEAMHKRFGRLPFRDLFQPAIYYAEHGVKISPLLASYFSMREEYLRRTVDGRAFMGQVGYAMPRVGDVFVQRELAKTLREVSRKGARYMYAGAWGRQFVLAVQQAGGKATMEDMKRYRPIWEEPFSTTFLGDTVYAPGKSSDGGYQVLEALNLAEALKLDQMGPYSESPKSFATLSRILTFVQIDNLRIPQVDEFNRQHGLSLLPEDRITKPYAEAAVPVLNKVFVPPQQRASSEHSDAIVVIDRWGNVAALCHSINTVLWGTTGIVVGGIPVPDPAGFQQATLARIKPGDPVPDPMTPLIATRDGKPILAVVSVGSSLIQETVRVAVTAIANRLPLKTVMAGPPLLLNTQRLKPGETLSTRPEPVPEEGYSAEFLKALEAGGLNTEPQSSTQVAAIRGTAVVAATDPANGNWQSVETPGVFDFAASY
jgi:gamma-glutamyltranspeptidase / glutathione hydrolase